MHGENPYTKNMENHSHRNVHDENPYTKNMESHCTECANDLPYSFYMDFRHAHFCAKDFPYSFVFFRVCNALKGLNSMVQGRIINDTRMCIGLTKCLMLSNA